MGCRRPSSAWAASGEPSGSSGRPTASTRPQWATPAGSRLTPPTRRSAAGRTGHSEVVLVAFDTTRTSYAEMLRRFWEGHDPTQGMRQGNDVGTQYRSLIVWSADSPQTAAEASLRAYQQMLSAAGHGTITTELAEVDPAHP